MKRFIRNIILFSVLVLSTLGIGELWLRSQSNPYSAKRDYIVQHGDGIETAVLGSSHTYYGIIPDSLGENTVNLANVSQTFEYDYRILKRFVGYFPKLKKVIVPVSYFSFYDAPYPDGDEWFYEIYYKIYMGVDKYSFNPKYMLEMSSFPTYSGKIKSLLTGKSLPECSEKGFGLGYCLTDRAWKEKASETCLRHTAKDFTYEGFNKSWLDSLLDLCGSRAIDVVMVSTPKSEEYIRLLDSCQYARTVRIVDSVAQSRKIPFFNFSTDARFGDSDFFDPDHLSDSGAGRFTVFLRDSLHTL